jgi:HSP20 family protein
MYTFYKTPFDKIVDSILTSGVESANNEVLSSNLKTTDTEYRLQISVPGLTKEDIKTSIKEGVLTIQYDGLSSEDFSFVKKFKKSYNIPDDCDDKNIAGKVENGVLELVFPKQKKKNTERSISLN